MRYFIGLFFFFTLQACAAQQLAGEWPETRVNRVVLERVSLDGRIVVIEQVPRFLVPGNGGGINVDASFDHYFFWDFCRSPKWRWQMVVLRPDGRANSGWSFTRTVTTPATKRQPTHTRVTEGYVKRQIAGYAALRAAGLAFFKPGEIQCDARYGDPLDT